jgi:hypothetical protein
MGHSVAAVSCTEDSLVSYNTKDTHHTPNRSGSRRDRHHEEQVSTITKQPPLPEKLQSPIPPKATFEAIWHKFQMDGWDMFQNQETSDLTFQAPNGYTFESQRAFEQYLQDEYGWQPPPPPGKTRRQMDLEQREQQAAAQQRQKLLWDFVKGTMGWSYDFKRGRDALGENGRYLYFRPGFSVKNRGIAGEDHFTSLEELEKYCQRHGIHPPPTPSGDSSSASSDEELDHDKSGDDHEDDDGAMGTDDEEREDDDGYETPTDQATSPQDPGKPLGLEDSEKGESSEDDEARYDWGELWPKLKAAGWEHKKSPNELENYWYCKPVRHISWNEDEGEKAPIEGVDYFTSPEAVIAYCRDRDAKLHGKSKKKTRPAEKDEHPAKKSKSNKHSSRKLTTHEAVTKSIETALENASKGKKRGRKTTTNATSKRARQSPQYTCDDENLMVASSANNAPWARQAPLFEHKVVIDPSNGITYSNAKYYLPGESSSDFTHYFENVTDLVHFCAQSGKFDASETFQSPSKNSHQQEFARYLRYAFVPGKPSEWAVIRMITKAEASYLFEKAGYRKMTGKKQQESWCPPEALVSAYKLKSSYRSMDSLCLDLVLLEDLESAGGSSRRRKQGNLSLTQLMALRLAIADGFAKEDATTSDAPSTPEAMGSEEEDKTASRPQRDKKASVVKGTKGKKRDRSSEEKRQSEESVLTPGKIKVRFEGETNPAPWASKPLLDPKENWHSCVTKMGCTYIGGVYYLPGKTARNTTDRFTRSSDLVQYICEEGQYEKYLDMFEDEQEKSILRRHFSYANVPGNQYEWKKIRRLSLRETILFLNLLGFEKDAEGLWSVPHGVKHIDGQKYTSLSELGEALVRVPDLEDRTKGQSNYRRSKQTDRILNDKQMIALRLRIAEGIEDEDALSSYRAYNSTEVNHHKRQSMHNSKCSVNDSRLKSGDKSDDESSLVPTSSEADDADDVSASGSFCAVAAKKAKFEVCRHKDAWKFLQHLGCRYTGSSYLLPNGHESFENQNQLVYYILKNGASVLDWKNCTLEYEDIETLEFYFRCFAANLNSSSPTAAATKLVEEGGVTDFLEKIGVCCVGHDMYTIGSEKYNQAEIVDKIRCSEDLFTLAKGNDAKPSRQKPLTEEEILAVRLWAIQVPTALADFPDPHELHRMRRQAVTQKCRKRWIQNLEVSANPQNERKEISHQRDDPPAEAEESNAEEDFFTPTSNAADSIPNHSNNATTKERNGSMLTTENAAGQKNLTEQSILLEDKSFEKQDGKSRRLLDYPEADVAQLEHAEAAALDDTIPDESDEASSKLDYQKNAGEAAQESIEKGEARTSSFGQWEDQIARGQNYSPHPFDASTPDGSLLRYAQHAPFTQPDVEQEDDQFDFAGDNQLLHRSIKDSRKKVRQYGGQREMPHGQVGTPAIDASSAPEPPRRYENADSSNGSGRKLF